MTCSKQQTQIQVGIGLDLIKFVQLTLFHRQITFLVNQSSCQKTFIISTNVFLQDISIECEFNLKQLI